MFKGKRELLAQCIYWSGVTFFLNRLPAKNALLVLVYHRIGDSSLDAFDPGVFSATGDQLDEQISYLKRNASIVSLEEAQSFLDGTLKDTTPRGRVLFTFDDGYLDNYEIAFPILRSHGVQGVFFLSTGLIGSCAIPWWDEIAFTLKTARTQRFSLRYPADMSVDILTNGLHNSIRSVMDLYKQPHNAEPDRFLRELKEATSGDDLPGISRRFLGWDEAAAMLNGGMAIGSHCHSHRVLSQLTPEQQRYELNYSRHLLRERLGVTADSVAYPVGIKAAFSEQTQVLAREAGYRVAFSYYGGTNLMETQSNTFDVKRTGIFAQQSQLRFRVQSTHCRVTGLYWP